MSGDLNDIAAMLVAVIGIAERQLDPNQAAIAEERRSRAMTRYANTTSAHASFDLTEYFAKDCKGAAPPCSDYVGPVEIRRVNYGHSKRGLFTTSRVEAGSILLASNPLAIVRNPEVDVEIGADTKMDTGPPWAFRHGQIFIGLHSQEDLITELATKVFTSKRKMAQFYSLGNYRELEMEIPSMELFRPGSEWVPPGAEKLQVDIPRIRRTIRMNLFQYGYSDHLYRVRETDKDDHAAIPVSCGIWLLPSFANHSCAPSCLTACIGDTMFFRAARDMEEGEELTIPYFEDLYEPVHTRKLISFFWRFQCSCERCSFENTLEPHFSKLIEALPGLVEAARAEEDSSQQGHNWQATKKLCAVADEVEALLESLQVDPKKRGWIRASFLEAYQLKIDLSIAQGTNEDSQLKHKLFSSALKAVTKPAGAIYLFNAPREITESCP